MGAESRRIVDELDRAVEGDPWHGSPVRTILRGITADMAAKRPPGGAHSIWEIVRHMTAWTNEVARRAEGAPAATPREGDWPTPSGTGPAAWKRDIVALLDAHRHAAEVIGTYSDEQLFESTNDPRNRETGTGVTRYVLLHGLAQHHAYHAGQIAILKRFVKRRPRR